MTNARFVARQSSILHSRAELLVLPLPSDGVVYDRTLTRLLGLYPSVLGVYKELAQKGKLALGDVLIYPVQKEIAGLGVGSPKTANHIAIIIAHHHTTDPVRLSTLKHAYGQLHPKLFELMRAKSLRLVAIYQHITLFGEQTADDVWQVLTTSLDVSRLTMEVYFDKAMFESVQALLENKQEQ